MAEAAGFHDSYTIGSQLGSGAFSVVNEATPVGGGPKVAVKCIRYDPPRLPAAAAAATPTLICPHPRDS